MPRLLDLFCGAGGASAGYARLGFEVIGVDLAFQPSYPFEFHRADATQFPLEGFDYIHASPPCQGFSKAQFIQGIGHAHKNLLGITRQRLIAQGTPWVIENVPQAPMRVDMMLCGSACGRRRLRRHRIFEFHQPLPFPMIAGCRHGRDTVSVFGHGGHHYHPLGTWKRIMEMPWCVNRDEIAEAIPPFYAEEVGQVLMSVAKLATLLKLQNPPD